MALIGNIEAFTGVPEEFESYIERLAQLFIVNTVSMVLKNLVVPPTDFTFQEVKEKLIKHFSPLVSEIYERFVFNRCEQKADQYIFDYSVELRKLAYSCNFGQFLEEALSDRFVCGIRVEGIQKKLLGEVDLTYQSACQLALASEVAQKQVKLLSEGEVIIEVNVQLKNEDVLIVQKLGHVKNLYPDIQPQPMKVVQEEEYNIERDEVKNDIFTLHTVSDMSNSAYHVTLKINNNNLTFEVDTGARRAVNVCQPIKAVGECTLWE
ncbi:unnamed protein product [Diabrotica balteata]|uniref:Uncharacterized protein n=1 Tax=Diabrotica balteata TaxID=107213 RepID=A0A9N9X7Y7_DIABA|nr:unnamed protein product [Diabrotica balteata]